MLLAVIVGFILKRWRWILAWALVPAAWQPLHYELISKLGDAELGYPVLSFPADWREYALMSATGYGLFVLIASAAYGLKRAYVWASPEATARRQNQVKSAPAPASEQPPPDRRRYFRVLTWVSVWTLGAVLIGYAVEGRERGFTLGEWLADSYNYGSLPWAIIGATLGIGWLILRPKREPPSPD